MSEQEKDEILSHLKSLRGLLNWLGGGVLMGMVGVGWIMITDHFDQRNLKHDVEIMKPRVEVLWYSREAERSR